MSTMPQFDRPSVCVGILGSDPLRSIGLQSILEEGLEVRTVILPDETRPRGQKISVLIIDQDFRDAADLSVPLNRSMLHMPGVAIVVLARGDLPVAAEEMIAAGARGVLPVTAHVADIRACIRAVLRGKVWTPRERSAEEAPVIPLPEKKPEQLANRFTPREREVMHWLAHGHSNRQIAATMGIDEATVKAHLGRMLRKADATNRVELTLRALSQLKSPPPKRHA